MRIDRQHYVAVESSSETARSRAPTIHPTVTACPCRLFPVCSITASSYVYSLDDITKEHVAMEANTAAYDLVVTL
jgi:hypothetical protein